MTLSSPIPPIPPPVLRLDPSPSRVFSWLEWNPDAPEVRDEATNRLVQPAGPALTVRFRTTGTEWAYWPVSEQEARQVLFPSAVYNFSIGQAFSSIIKAHKSSRHIRSEDRQATKEQRTEQEQRAGRRWLA
jgi:hypothetical protein